MCLGVHVWCFRFLDLHVSIHTGGPVYHCLHLHQLHLLWPFQIPQSTQLRGERLLMCAYAVTSLSPFTLRPHFVCFLLQVKEEDEDTAVGVKENTMVLYLLRNRFQSTIRHFPASVILS